LILSIWAPICGTGAEARDGRLLIASAVSMAMNLHLQSESKRVFSLRAEKNGLSPDKQAELNESTRRWRLVVHIFLSESHILNGSQWMYLSISESMYPLFLPSIFLIDRRSGCVSGLDARPSLTFRS
jgi:hypothetical protein